MRVQVHLVAATVVLAVIVAAPMVAAAAPPAGWLDPTFGASGSVLVPRAESGSDRSNTAMAAVSPTGRIYVLSWRERTTSRPIDSRATVELAAYTSAGRPDPAFHGGRPVIAYASSDTAECCNLEGPFPTADGGVEVGIGVFSSFVVQRYAASGVRTWQRSVFHAMVGMTVLAGGSTRALSFDFFENPGGPSATSLVGVTPAGQADTRVGPGGVRLLTTMDGSSGILRDAVNRLYVVGSQYPDPTTTDRVTDVRRLTSSGDPDVSWGTAGVTIIQQPDAEGTPGGTYGANDLTALALGPDNSLFLSGRRTDPATHRVEVVIRKLTPSGAADGGFGVGGLLVVPAPSGSSRTGTIAIDANGRLVVAFVDRAASGPQPELARFDAVTGAVDPSFGRIGMLTTSNLIIDLARTGGGKIIAISHGTVAGHPVLYLSRRFG